MTRQATDWMFARVFQPYHEPWFLALPPHLEDHRLRHDEHGWLKLPPGRKNRKFSCQTSELRTFWRHHYNKSASGSEKGDNNLTNVNPGRTTALTESSWWSHMTKGMGSYGVPSSETERLMMCRILTVVLGPYQPDWRKWIIWHQKSLPFASIITFNMQRWYRWWKKSCTTWDVKKPVVKNGINHQPQLVSVPDFWQDPLDVKTCKAWRVPATLGKGNSRDPGPCLFLCLTHDSPPCKCVSICVSEICRSDF